MIASLPVLCWKTCSHWQRSQLRQWQAQQGATSPTRGGTQLSGQRNQVDAAAAGVASGIVVAVHQLDNTVEAVVRLVRSADKAAAVGIACVEAVARWVDRLARVEAAD